MTKANNQSVDLSPVGAILAKHQDPKGELIALLQDLQELYGYLPQEVLLYIADKADIPMARLAGVATFYAQFHLECPGKYQILICNGTACHVNRSQELAEIIEDKTGVAEEQTSLDGLFFWRRVACLGCCSLAPVMMVNSQVYGKLDKSKTAAIIDELRNQERTVR